MGKIFITYDFCPVIISSLLYHLNAYDSKDELCYDNLYCVGKNKMFSSIVTIPNPFNDVITLAYKADFSETIRVAVYDSNGSLVLDKFYESNDGYNEIELNLSDEIAGYYLYHISSTSLNEFGKMIKI